MADNFTVLTSNGTTTATFRATDVGGGILGMMSIPMNPSGTAMIGQAVMATSIPVAIASNQTNLPMNIVQFGGTAVTLGQAVMATSIPVAIASNQSNVPINLAAWGGTATTLGQKVSATSVPVVLPSDQIVSTNISQVGGTTFGLGQKVMATSISVVISSDQSTIPSNLAQVNGTTVNAGAGATGAGTQRITLASDSPGIITTGTQAAPSSTYISSVVAGDVASATNDTGNPVKAGAVGHTAAPTAVTDGQRVNLIADKTGKLIAVGAIRELKANQTASLTTAAETVIFNAINGTTFADVYGLILANTGATATRVDIRSGIGSAIIMPFEVPATDTRGFMLPADSAVAQPTANFSWTAQCSATTTLSVTTFCIKNI